MLVIRLWFSGLWFYNLFSSFIRFSFSGGWVKLCLELFLKWLYIILLQIIRSTLFCSSIFVILFIQTLLVAVFKSWELQEWGLFYITPILSPSTIYYLIIVPIYISGLSLLFEPVVNDEKVEWLLNISY